MKKLFTLLLLMAFVTSFAQNDRPIVPKHLKDIGIEVQLSPVVNKNVSISNPGLQGPVPDVISETKIGNTYYDLQTNGSNQNRFYRYPDSSMAATWIFSAQTALYTDRGTGYNYFNGSSWGSYPTSRIEAQKVGWPSYCPLGPSGEMVVTHIGATGVNIAQRTVKGTGTWSQSTFAGPTASHYLLWPRTITSGPNHNYVHLMALTPPVANGGTLYNGMDGALVYSRSTNGGTTWSTSNIQIPGTDTAYYRGLSGDSYAWAEPKDSILAFIVGDSWYDLFLLKSTNNGVSWSKTVIWQHPYPFFNSGTPPYATDTFYCPDGALAAAIDNNGLVHVFFGVNRAYSNGTTSNWFPFIDGLAYWNDDMPPITSTNFKFTLHPDSLALKGLLVGWVQDDNSNGIVDVSNVGYFYMSMSSMPTATIDQNNHIFLVYSSIRESVTSVGGQNFRHLYGRKSIDGGVSWGDIIELTAGSAHNSKESVFPSMASYSDDKIHLIYQWDSEPGLCVRGDLDPAANNDMIYLNVDKTDFVHIPPGPTWIYTSTSNQHKIDMPPLANITINGNSISSGDYVGLFYDAGTSLECAGYKKIMSPSDTVIAYGTDVGMNNGFANGETFKWKIWKTSSATEYQAIATYNTSAPNGSTFQTNGLSSVTLLTGGVVNIMASPGPTVCPGVNTTLQILVSGGYPPYTYSWSPTASLNNPNISSPVASPMNTTNYVVTVTDNIGLMGTASVLINIIPPPVITHNPVSDMCDNWPAIQLPGGTPSGGTYSGIGVSGLMFNPTTAGAGTHNIVYSYTSPTTGCTGHDTVAITVLTCVGNDIPELHQSINIYPNPFNDDINILITGKVSGDIRTGIYHPDGRMIRSLRQAPENGRISINTASLKPGLYFIRMETENKTIVRKIIKSE